MLCDSALARGPAAGGMADGNLYTAAPRAGKGAGRMLGHRGPPVTVPVLAGTVRPRGYKTEMCKHYKAGSRRRSGRADWRICWGTSFASYMSGAWHKPQCRRTQAATDTSRLRTKEADRAAKWLLLVLVQDLSFYRQLRC